MEKRISFKSFLLENEFIFDGKTYSKRCLDSSDIHHIRFDVIERISSWYIVDGKKYPILFDAMQPKTENEARLFFKLVFWHNPLTA